MQVIHIYDFFFIITEKSIKFYYYCQKTADDCLLVFIFFQNPYGQMKNMLESLL